MAKLMPTQWLDVMNRILALSDNAEPAIILQTLIELINKYRDAFSSEPFASYHFERYFDMKEADYPAKCSRMKGTEFLHFKNIIASYEIQNLEGIARNLNETLEKLIVKEIESQCPACEHFGLGVYKSHQSCQSVLECSQCGLVTSMDGSRIIGESLVFATNDDLQMIE